MEENVGSQIENMEKAYNDQRAAFKTNTFALMWFSGFCAIYLMAICLLTFFSMIVPP